MTRPHDLALDLAWYLANAKPGDANLAMLNRLYRAMQPKDQLRCRAEMEECRAARRGEREASWTAP